MRTWLEHNYCSIDLQLWNTIANQEQAISKLVTAVGGNIEADSTSSFLITTGGMSGIHNSHGNENYNNDIVPSLWCQGDSDKDSRKDKNSVDPTFSLQLQGLGVVISEMLSNFVTKADPTVLILCPNQSSVCRALENVDYRQSHVIPLYACSVNIDSDNSSLDLCEEEMAQKIVTTFSLSNDIEKIGAIVVDADAPLEMGQITNRIFVRGTSSYQWLSHDYVVLAPSPTTRTSQSDTNHNGIDSTSWRYQFLERFRTDLVEFNPVYHATIAFDDHSSNSNWNIGVLCAGNSWFYDHLIKTLNKIRHTLDFDDVSLLESKTGLISHIPDYQPGKWATPSDYDLEPVTKQWLEQRPLGRQLLAQYEKVPSPPDDISVGARVVFQCKHGMWCRGYVLEIWDDEDERKYTCHCEGMHERMAIDVGRMFLVELKAEMQMQDTIHFGSTVLADGEENLDYYFWYPGQIIGMNYDGKYKVYFFSSGETGLLDRRKVVQTPETTSLLPVDSKAFSSCDDFEQFLFNNLLPIRGKFNKKVGDGCVVVVSSSSPRRDIHKLTVIATYDGRKHFDLNVYSSDNVPLNLVNEIAIQKNIPGFKRTQIDSYPRGYGRVVAFGEDLTEPYFGTKYPKSI
mmetsp:Transcript_11425/g.11130  ORF Transcript_11425/g.11130 Transcript_11425/m.11130 type:complete len:625 (+) Transcript_11425:2599-4473(+)